MGNAEQMINDSNESFLDELSPGTELLQGQYKIDKFLNSGGFGITYLASDSLERKVVIKECFPSSFCNRSRSIVQARSRAHTAELRSVVQLFVQEARSLAKLSHPNIVGVHQVFEDNDTAYMVLDFIEGRDLLDTLEDENHGLTAPQIKGILKDVLGAVQFIHDQDILHRDISPDNILLDADMRPVLIDFGAAREEATKKSRVLSALRVVKDGYSPQEFYIQGSEQTPSSDLYALGATFHHLIAGEIPPNSQARLAAIASGEADPYVPLAGQIKGYDTKFLSAIDTALGILPKDRMQSAEDWLGAMEGNRRKSRVVTQPIPMSSAAAASLEPEKRSALVPLLGSVAVVALLALGGLAATDNLPTFGEVETAAVTPAIESDAEVAEASATDITANLAAADVVEAPTVSEDPEVTIPTQTIGAFDPADTAQSDTPVIEGAKAEEAVALDTEAGAQGDAPVVAENAPVADETALADAAVDQAEIALAEDAVVLEAEAPVVAEAEESGAVIADTGSAPVDLAENVAPVETAEISPQTDITPEVEAPQPEIVSEPEAPVEIAQEVEAPAVVATAEPTLRPRPRLLSNVPAAPAQDDIANVALAGEDIAAPAPQPEPEFAIISTRMRFGLPFEAVTGTNVIATSADVAPVWVRPGTRILTVNGLEVEQISDIDRLLESAATPENKETMQVTFSAQASDALTPSEHSWVLPIRHETSLPDGTVFETFWVNDEWRTVVAAVPGTEGELQVGDVVVAFVETSEIVSDHVALREVLERELVEGTKQFSFAVTREGSMWVVAMTYAKGA